MFDSWTRRHTFGLSLLLVFVLVPRGFSPGTPVCPSPQKPTFLNSNSIWTWWTKRHYGCATAYFHLFIYLFIHSFIHLFIFYLFIYLFIHIFIYFIFCDLLSLFPRKEGERTVCIQAGICPFLALQSFQQQIFYQNCFTNNEFSSNFSCQFESHSIR